MSAASTPVPVPGEMTHRQVLEALSGLLLGMFVAILASTVVSTSLPRIIHDLNGDQTAYTWVVTSTLLATTVSTPIWGKLADLMNRKLLVQLSLVIFVLGSALAGLSQDTNTLIIFRVLQGLGAGGLTSLVQVILSDIIAPRERGRYMGYLGAVLAVGTAGGPAPRRVHHRRHRLALELLRGRARGDRRDHPHPADPETADPAQEGQHRLHRHRAHRRGRLAAADLGEPRRKPVRVGIGHLVAHGHRRRRQSSSSP